MNKKPVSVSELFDIDPFAEKSPDVRRAQHHGRKRKKKKQYHIDNPTIAFRIPRATRNQLRSIAKERGISLNALMQEITTDWLRGKPQG